MLRRFAAAVALACTLSVAVPAQVAQMATVQLLAPTRLDAPITLADRAWPAGQNTYTYQLISSFFNNGAVTVRAQFSFDNGQTWPNASEDTWAAGSRAAKDGADPSVTVGPFRFGDPPTIVNPTTVRITVSPASGTPRVGLLGG